MKKATIVNIGDELLIGQIINTNASFIAEKLTSTGLQIQSIIVVGDNFKDLKRTFNEISETDFVIVTGGLGPTKDDITKHFIYKWFDTEPILNEDIQKDIIDYFNAKKLPLLESNLQQAILPKKAIILKNKRGTAAGMWLNKNEVDYFFMPGVPYEMEEMLCNDIMPILRKKSDNQHIEQRHIFTMGIGESFLAEKINSIVNNLPSHITIAFLPNINSVKLRITGFYDKKNADFKELDEITNKIKLKLNDFILAMEETNIIDLVFEKLKQENKTLALGESCTGGYLAHLLTSKSGASSIFKGSCTTYSNASKINLLDVSKNTLDQKGAVSRETVQEMLDGVIQVFKSDYAIAISGIAGPNGGSENKPLGTIYIGVCNAKNTTIHKFNFKGNRRQNIERSAIQALFMLYTLNN